MAVDNLPSTPSKGKKTITLVIDEKLWNRLVVQLQFLRELNIPELDELQTPEDIILFYINQLTMTDNEHERLHGELTNILKTFSDRGVNMRDLLNAFTEHKVEDEEKEIIKPQEDEEKEDWEVEDEEE